MSETTAMSDFSNSAAIAFGLCNLVCQKKEVTKFACDLHLCAREERTKSRSQKELICLEKNFARNFYHHFIGIHALAST